MNSQILKNLVLWLVIFVAIIALYQFINAPRTTYKEISYSEFLTLVDQNNVSDIEFNENNITGKFNITKSEKEPKEFKTVGPSTDELVQRLESKNINFSFTEKKESSLTQLLINWAPLIILIALMVLFMRQIQAGGTKAMSFGKNKARMLTENQNKITFKDVAGVDEAKEEV
ncbi:MAG: ATP-dependent metallopeptidase FtsH/Yme1/Tma family protein, partial [Thermodesulfobacteriota bacterium]